ncbi:MAG: winged helix-turn-helix domain-containing protein [Nitrososphaerota archaeon]
MSREEKRVEVASILKAVSSPIRLSIIEALNTSQMNFSELIKYTGLSEQSEVGKFTYHLKTLLRAGLVEYSSRSRVYSLTPLGSVMVEIIHGLHRRTTSNGLIALGWDYYPEQFNRNIIAEYAVEAVRIPIDLARRVSILIEKRLEELQANIIPRWLLEDFLRVELLFSNVGLEKLSNITPAGPTIQELYKVFRSSVEKGSRELLNRYIHETMMRRLVVERFFPEMLRQQYYLGEIDLHPLALSLTHVLSISLAKYDESTVGAAMKMTLNDLTFRVDTESKPNLSPDPWFGLPENVYFLVEDSIPEIISKYYAKGVDDSGLEAVLKRGSWSDRIKIGLPARKSAPLVYSYYQGAETLFTQYMIRTSAASGFGIYSIIGINALRLLRSCGFEKSAMLQEMNIMIGRLSKYLKKCVQYLHTFHEYSSKIQMFYLLAPIGLVEALKSIPDGLEGENKYNLLFQVVESLVEAANSIPTLRGRVIVASYWPSRLSARLYSIDRVMLVGGPSTSSEALTPLSPYCNSLSEIFSSLNLDQIYSLARLLGGIVMKDQFLDRLVERHGKEHVQDLLQSLPILLVASF